LYHCRQSIELRHNTAQQFASAREVNDAQERRKPRFNEKQSTLGMKDAADFGQGSFQIVRKERQMVQSSLNDYNVPAIILERQLSAVADIAFRFPAVL
jgi:hypothetical protein